jgi:hypothetical protein
MIIYQISYGNSIKLLTDSPRPALPNGHSLRGHGIILESGIENGGPVVFVLSGELESRGELTLFDNAIDQPLKRRHL